MRYSTMIIWAIVVVVVGVVVCGLYRNYRELEKVLFNRKTSPPTKMSPLVGKNHQDHVLDSTEKLEIIKKIYGTF